MLQSKEASTSKGLVAPNKAGPSWAWRGQLQVMRMCMPYLQSGAEMCTKACERTYPAVIASSSVARDALAEIVRTPKNPITDRTKSRFQKIKIF